MLVLNPGLDSTRQHIAIVGGTFDPPHFGHTTLIKAAVDILKCSRVIVRPCNGNPLKPDAMAEFKHRVNMCKLMFGQMTNVEVSDYEQNLPAPTYSYNTVKSMFNEYGMAYYHFIVGEDTLVNLERWHNLEGFFAYADLYAVGPNVVNMHSQLPYWIQRNTGYIEMDSVSDIHATQIRKQLAESAHTTEHTMNDVLQYITEHDLYR